MFKERREHLYNMKNKYLTKCLCITLMSAMVLTGNSIAVPAAEMLVSGGISTDDQLAGRSELYSDLVSPPDQEEPELEEPTPVPPEVTPKPEVIPTPEVTPEPEVTPTPEVIPTPEATPTPEVTPEPSPVLTERAKRVIDMIEAFSGINITLEHKSQILNIRKQYQSLSLAEKLSVTNYENLVKMEKEIDRLEGKEETSGDLSDGSGGELSDALNAQIGNPVYYTNMVANLHAGKEFYLNSLEKNYHLSFSEDFSHVMEEIEQEYKEKNKLVDASDRTHSVTTTSADSLLVKNWQDILAIYIYEQSCKGVQEYKLDASSKEALSQIFGEMNPVVRDKKDITKVSYGSRHINYYIKKNKISRQHREILKKYMETDCKLLCSVVTGAKGFVRQSVGDGVSEERVNVITAAYSLVGKVGYFWGGKSISLGLDPSWGQAVTVSEAGSRSSGTVRAYGLDCSGFVTWAVINGYQNQGMQDVIGDGTSEQWTNANVVSEADAQPGDLVFQRGPEAGSDNHVGILCGKTDAGDWIAVHCSSGKNGVTVGEAYSASFRYIRQPSFYPTEAEMIAMENAGTTSDLLDASSDDVILSSDLQNVITSGTVSFDAAPGKTLLDDAAVEPFVLEE